MFYIYTASIRANRLNISHAFIFCAAVYCGFIGQMNIIHFQDSDISSQYDYSQPPPSWRIFNT